MPLCRTIWNEYAASAVTERIISQYVGKKHQSSLLHVGADYGMLANDVILSPLVSVKDAQSWHIGEFDNNLAKSISRYFSAHTNTQHQMSYATIKELVFKGAHNVVVISGLYSKIGAEQYRTLLQEAWSHLAVNGILIVHEDMAENRADIEKLDAMVAENGSVHYHSLIAARNIEPAVEISQYSLAVEENLRQEKQTKQNVFRVVRKL